MDMGMQLVWCTASDVSGGVTSNGQANQRGAALPSFRITTARFEGHNIIIIFIIIIYSLFNDAFSVSQTI
jgi:hypothetical protein